MPLNDCIVATTLETVDSSMAISGMGFLPAFATQGGVQVAAIQGNWTLNTNPYVTGVQFEYVPTDGSAPPMVDTQRGALNSWIAFTGILSGRSYSVRYRAAGPNNLYGDWSMAATVMAGTVVSPAPAQPGATAWSAVGTTTTANGVSFPAITVSGVVDATGATEVVIYFAPHGAATFLAFGTYPINTTSVLLDSVGSGVVVDIGIAYKNGETTGPMRILTNSGAGYTAGAFSGSGASTIVTPSPTPAWADQVASGAGTQTTVTNAQTFGAINTPILLTLTYTNTAAWAYIKNGAAPAAFASGGTVTVNAGDSLAYQCSSGATVTSVLSIVNSTDGGALLDTTTATITVTSVDAHADAIVVGNVHEDSYALSPCYGFFDQFSVTGINVPCSIALGVTGLASVAYSLNGTPYIDGTSFTANNNDTVSLYVWVNGSAGSYGGSVNITNVTDASTVMAAPTYLLHIHPGEWP